MMNRQGSALFEAPLAHEVGLHTSTCNCSQCRGIGAFEWEVIPSGSFTPVAVETPGGGRIGDKRDPAPADIVHVQGVGRRIPLHKLAAAAWQALVNKARADGIPAPLLLPTSGYRSYERQAELWQQALLKYGSSAIARRYVAPPGGSAHQSGRAIDFYLGGRNDSGNIPQLRKLPAYRWIVANAQRFGFYPYPREPWHWEYNPPASIQRPTLRRGSRGPTVRDLQTRLNRWMASQRQITTRLLIVDGIFGPLTQGAVYAFQRWAGLKTDAIVGPLTWGQLLRLNPAPGPQPPSPPSTAPAVISREYQPPDITLYVDIPLGGEGRARPMTGIYIPENYHPQPAVDLILFLHGFKEGTDRKRPDYGITIYQYWHSRLPPRPFREGVHASQKNVILVSPTLGQFSEPGTLTEPGGFDHYIDQVMAALVARGPYRGQRPAVGNIILAAHSGGGGPMLSIAQKNQRYTSLIRQCWAFDSMYGDSTGEKWARWAVKNPQATLYNYYRQTRDKNGRPNYTWPASADLEQRNLPNVRTTAVPCEYSRGRESCKCSHDQVPIQYWRTRISGATFLTDR